VEDTGFEPVGLVTPISLAKRYDRPL